MCWVAWSFGTTLCVSVAEWLGCSTCINRSRVPLPVAEISGSRPGQVVYMHVALSQDSINLVPAQAGNVTVGLTSHRPCGTDISGISTCKLTALEREMIIAPTLHLEYGPSFCCTKLLLTKTNAYTTSYCVHSCYAFYMTAGALHI